MQKTRIVEIARLKKHVRYEKFYTVTNRVKAHDEKSEYKTGEKVIIKETRPLSKEKRWIIVGRASSEEKK